MSTTREPFYDPGDIDATKYIQQLLLSREFPTDLLTPAARDVFQVPGFSKLNKDELAETLAPMLVADPDKAWDVAVEFVSRPRMWLAVQIGKTKTPNKKVGSSTGIFEYAKGAQWHGPICHVDNERFWYVYVQRVPVTRHVKTDGGTEFKKNQKTVWYVIAEVGKDYAALSWDGFTYAHPHVATPTQGQFAFWEEIPKIFNSLAAHVGGEWDDIDLKRLVLHRLWNKYVGNSGYDWVHLKLKANHMGVGLNATSAPRTEDEQEDTDGNQIKRKIAGLRALTEKLAATALRAIGKHDSDSYTKVKDALLCEVIKEWRPLSYEFSLDKLKVPKSETNIFRANVYFGQGRGQDKLCHFKTYRDYRSSVGALEFVLEEARADLKLQEEEEADDNAEYGGWTNNPEAEEAEEF